MEAAEAQARCHLLLVDDDQDVLRDVAASLERLLGCSISAYSDAGAAIERAKEVTFDCAVLDMDMPGLNGLQLARALRAVQAELPIFFLTGSAGDFPQHEIDALATKGVLSKPVRPTVLAAHLRRVLG